MNQPKSGFTTRGKKRGIKMYGKKVSVPLLSIIFVAIYKYKLLNKHILFFCLIVFLSLPSAPCDFVVFPFRKHRGMKLFQPFIQIYIVVVSNLIIFRLFLLFFDCINTDD
jgi:hypothetical protein